MTTFLFWSTMVILVSVYYCQVLLKVTPAFFLYCLQPCFLRATCNSGTAVTVSFASDLTSFCS